MERSHGEEGIDSKCRKDKGHAWTSCRVQVNTGVDKKASTAMAA